MYELTCYSSYNGYWYKHYWYKHYRFKIVAQVMQKLYCFNDWRRYDKFEYSIRKVRVRQ
jgi:hypothetical protein